MLFFLKKKKISPNIFVPTHAPGIFNESLEAVQVAHKLEPLSDSSVPSC